MQGKIVKQVSNQYTVLFENKLIECQARGKFREKGISPFVGDLVIFNKNLKIIEEILPRKNYLNRPNISNIDYALIVTSLKQPELSLTLLDKLITNIILHKIKPIICFTKLDLLNTKEEKEEYEIIKEYYQKINISVFTNQNIDELLKFLANKVVVLTGQSGVGKSTLLNKIDPHLQLQTNEISYVLNRGKHTTRHRELFYLKNVWFCDTPGFSSIDINNYNKEEIKNSFIEFQNYHCKYKDCFHLKEPDCKVKEGILNKEILISRYNNYKSFLKEVED